MARQNRNDNIDTPLECGSLIEAVAFWDLEAANRIATRDDPIKR